MHPSNDLQCKRILPKLSNNEHLHIIRIQGKTREPILPFTNACNSSYYFNKQFKNQYKIN